MRLPSPSFLLMLLAALPAGTATASLYMIGNSVSDQINHADFRDLVIANGNLLVIGKDSIPGASLAWHVDNPESGFTLNPYGQYPQAFANYTWDALSLQPFSAFATELPAAQALLDLFRVNSPDGVIYVYAQSLNSQSNSWDAGDWLADRAVIGDTARNADWFEDFTRALQDSRPAATVRMVPVGHVFWELHQRMLAGMVPGFTHINQVYQDGWHYPTVGDYIVMTTYYATMLDESPQGIARFSPYDSLAPEVAAQIEAAAWHVVKRTPLSGRAPALVISSPSLPGGLENAPYSVALTTEPAGGATFSLGTGVLPAGLSLSAAGVLSGTPTQNGIFPVTVQAQAGGLIADRDLILMIASDNVPVVDTQVIDAIPQGAATRQQMQRSGGVGGVTWSVSAGQLPYGLSLSPNGELSGTPWGVPGNYRVVLRATDSNPVAPSQVDREVAVPVVAPETATLQAGPLVAPPTLDGALDEPFWDLAAGANLALAGTVDNTAVFDVRYDATGLHFAFAVADDALVNDSGEDFHDDAIVVYLDGLHRRESEFNANDREIIISADGSLRETNGRATGMVGAVAPVSGGYTAELFVPWSNFDAPPASFPASLGLDVAVCDDDDGGPRDAWQAWVSATPAVRGPFQFGNLALLPQAVAANVLADSGFERQAHGGTLAFNVPIQTAQAGAGWFVSAAQRAFTDIGFGKGFPQTAIEAVRASDGSLLQIVHDARATTGAGWLTFDAYNPSASVVVRVWGYNGSAASVDAKLAAIANTSNPSGGSFDGLIASGTLAPGDRPANTWNRFALPADFGAGYDTIVVAFGCPSSVVTLRLDNVELGGALGRALSYAPPPVVGDPLPAANLVVNPGFEAPRAGTLGFNVRIQTAQAGAGWFTNPNDSRTFTQIVASAGNPGAALSANGGNEGAALQLIHDARATTGPGLLTLQARNPDLKMRLRVWGYRGTAAEVDARLAAVTNTANPSGGAFDTILYAADLSRTGAAADSWEHYSFAVDFADGYDYILIALSALSGLTDSYADNISLSAAPLQPPAPTLTLNAEDATAAEFDGDAATWSVAASHAPGLALPLAIAFSGSASSDGSDGAFIPEFAVLPARASGIEFSLQALADGVPEGPESLVIDLAASSRYAVGSPSQAVITLLDHPLDQWLFDAFAGPAPADDSDHDGLDWLVEYFSGTAPDDPASRTTPLTIASLDAGPGRFAVDLRLDPAASGVAASILVSDDLVTWSAYPLDDPALQLITETPQSDGTLLRALSVPLPAGTRAFVRLMVQPAAE
jgi:hypothetical protein